MIPEISIEGLEKSFGGLHAVAGVTLQLTGPAAYGLIGPNGAGKTTLLNLIGGFLRPDAGRCVIGGVDASRLPPHRVARLGLARTFQDVRFVREMSVLENVMLALPRQMGEHPSRAAFGVRWRREEAGTRDRAREILRRIGLLELQERPATQLSYGQQKLLSLGACIATRARVLLLDEPVAGVHPARIEEILSLLAGLRDEGRLIVLIEHDLAAVRQISDVVVVMDDGRIIAEGPPDRVLERPEILEAYVT